MLEDRVLEVRGRVGRPKTARAEARGSLHKKRICTKADFALALATVLWAAAHAQSWAPADSSSGTTAHFEHQTAEDGSPPGTPTNPARLSTSRPGVAAGGLPDVSLLASASADVTDPWFTDPQSKLLATGRFASVTAIHAGQVTPTLSELQAYDAVLVWSNFGFHDDAALGDVLADYVDAGGGVVIAVFANSSTTAGRALAGRWQTHGYELIPSGGGTASGAASLGIIFDPDHELIQGVTSFSGGSSSFRPTSTTLPSSAEKIASWSDGKTMVAVREDTVGARVDLGLYPPSDDVLSNFWDSSTDGDVLMANALEYAALRPPLIPGDSEGDGTVDLGDYFNFGECFTGAGRGAVAAGCVTFDFDHNDSVDCADWSAFVAAWTQANPPPDFRQCPVGAPALSTTGITAQIGVTLFLGAALVSCRRRLDAKRP